MAQNIEIANAQYNDVPSIEVPKQGGGTASFVDTTDADAIASEIDMGKTAYVNGVKLTGTRSGGGGSYTAGDGIDITNDVISLETASANDIGGVKVGDGLSIDANGVLSAIGGVTIDKLYSGNSTALSVGSELVLSHTWKDYDFVEFGVFPNYSYLSSNNPYCGSHIFSTKAIQDCYTANSNFRLGVFLNNNGSDRFVSLRIFDTKFVVNTQANSVCIEYIHGIKIGGGSYVLPIASASTLGGIKVGNNLSIDANGVLSSIGGGGGGGFASIDTSNVTNIYNSMSSWTNGEGTRVSYTATANCYVCGTFTGIISGGGTPAMNLGLDITINDVFVQKIYDNISNGSIMYGINLSLASGDTIKFEAKGEKIATKGYINVFGVKYT